MTAGEVESHGGDGEDDRASFNSLIKVEYIHRRRFATRTEARLKIATWITGFYNPRRRHSAAGGLPPEEVERIISEARRTGSESGRSGSAGAAVLVSRAKFVTAVPRSSSTVDTRLRFLPRGWTRGN